MNVYIVTGGWEYEGFEIINVYKNESDAIEAKRKEKDSGYDFVDVDEYEVLEGDK